MALQTEPETSAREDVFGSENLKAFLIKLSQLSQDHHIGIAGEPILFEMEIDDFDRMFRVNELSVLEFT